MLTTKDLEKRQKIASQLFDLLNRNMRHWRRQLVAEVALQFNARYSTGYYSAPEIEKVYTDLAERVDVPDEGCSNKGSCLIVTTRTYNMGGHTRVIEKWIESDPSRKYSLVLTDRPNGDTACIPERLAEGIKRSGGEIFTVYSEDNLLARAKRLRELSLRYETILLFLLEEDVVPLVAYGTKRFNRPVGLYNHIDHLYWTGVSIADYVADMRPWGYELSHDNRGIKQSMIVPVPAESLKSSNRILKADARKQLSIPQSVKLIVTCGREVKYKRSAAGSFVDIAEPLLGAYSDLMVLAIGMDFGDFPEWTAVAEKYPGRFRLIKRVPHTLLPVYHIAADLVIDSFPMEGITALEDAVHCNRPVLSCAKSIDWIVMSPSYCVDKDDVIGKAKRVLDDADFARKLTNDTLEIMEQMAGPDIFKDRLQEFMHELESKKHDVQCFESKPTGFIRNDYLREDQILGATGKPMFLAKFVLLRPYFVSETMVLLLRMLMERMKWCVKLLRWVQRK